MASNETEFQWPEEGFDGFPRVSSDDCVKYSVYIIGSRENDNEGTTKATLGKVISAANELDKELLRGYIWQRENFRLVLRSNHGVLFLHGQTNYGDSIEDEWLVVYLLRELTKQFPDLWVRVMDSDGEFLLAEAANALPPWLTPEVAENRVWLHHGDLVIIPPSAASNSDASSTKSASTKILSFTEAFDVLKNRPESLLHSPSIQSEAFYRLRNYPGQIKHNMHHAEITIPRKLAYILSIRPEYVTPAVEAFYLRDPIALRSLDLKTSTKGRFSFPPEDFVNVGLTFPRVGYAQLKSQQFAPPSTWAELLTKETTSRKFSLFEAGMKLTCGFEMLISLDSQNREDSSVEEIRRLLNAIETGATRLPSDEEISRWDRRQDDEGWLDVNFEDFEKELSSSSKDVKGRDSGFGDKAAQENLRKLVERFEIFLNDETAGAEGAESFDHAEENASDDEDEDEDEDLDSEGEDREVSFDEHQFARMMREMMGLPPEAANDGIITPASHHEPTKAEDGETDDKDSESREIQDIMERMETELNALGALDLDPIPTKIAAVQNTLQGKHRNNERSDSAAKEADEEELEQTEGELDIDLNLAKNLLESFKGQAGLPGPVGNLLGSLGLQLPRDEEDDNSGEKV